jgi:hypothetical protein
MPSWEDENLGTMKRCALWLVQIIGEGNSFTKTQLRDAFRDVAQIDRRMRDLRDHGWRIDTNREDLSLGANEQRFVQMGEYVWEPGKATKKNTTGITSTQRRELLVRDGHMCRSCGIGAGEIFAGTHEKAQLDVARRVVVGANGMTETRLVTECNRCRIGGRGLTADLEHLVADIGGLPAFERKILAEWVQKGERTFSRLESLWAAYRTLPADSRAEVASSLE